MADDGRAVVAIVFVILFAVAATVAAGVIWLGFHLAESSPPAEPQPCEWKINRHAELVCE